MILFILDINKKYFVSAIICIIFAEAYFKFSHGIHSNHMRFSFIVPIAAGYLPAKTRFGRKMLGSAATCLTVGLCLKGIFDISGGIFGYEIYYYIASAVFAVMFILMEVVVYVSERNHRYSRYKSR